MPFRSLETIGAWLEEFAGLGYRFNGEFKVIQQDGAGGADTGLVLVRLTDASTVITIQPEVRDAIRWVATMEPRESAMVLDAPALLNVAGELAVASALCAFLEAKSLAYVAVDSA
ncbi:hypothetical protein ACFPER_06405 [Agromyces aurantiacus]|uniref:Uncharacterized protein n=1 Tax=Agromyces aurantiacus TaxID=165814 RepID=A0ABV9R4N4_9MICO|nr:hypothetical protein [Agromyces aurantiacus]MBM7503095.1 hypothetical protein [Agromyces aurantiacus]